MFTFLSIEHKLVKSQFKMRKFLLGIILMSSVIFGQNNNEQLIKRADSLTNAKNYEESLKIWNTLRSDNNDKNNASYTVNYFYNKGLNEVIKGDDDQAIIYFKQALSYIPKVEPTLKNKKLTSNLYMELSYCFSDWNEALKYSKTCYDYTLKHLPNDINVINAIIDIGDIQRRLKNHEQSIISLEKAIKLINKRTPDDFEQLGYVHNLLAIGYSDLHFHNQSIYHYNKGLEFHIKSNEADKAYVVNSATNVIWESLRYGDDKKAKETLDFLNANFYNWFKQKEFATTNAGSLKNWNLHYKSLMYLSNLRWNVLENNESKAKQYLDSIALVFDTYPEKRKHKDNTLLLSRYAYENMFLSKPVTDENTSKKHIDFNRKTLEIARTNQSKHDELVACLNLAKAYERYKKYDKALSIINESKMIEETFFNASRFTIEVLEANILNTLNKTPESKKVFLKSYQKLLAKQKTLKSLKNLEYNDFKKFNSDVFIRNVLNTANTYFELFEKSKNEDDLITANTLYFVVSDMFSEFYQKGKYNYRLNDFNNEIASGLLQTQMRINPNDTKKIKDILNRIENNSSQHLWNIFETKSSQNLKVPSALIQDYNQLVFEKNATLQTIETTGETGELTKQLAHLNKEIQNKQNAINTYDASYQQFKSNNFNSDDIQNQLKESQLMIKYVVTDAETYAFVIDNKTIKLINLGATKSLKLVVEQHLKNINTISNDYTESANNLYQKLLQPILKNHTASSLIVNPEDFLNAIAFESLQDQKGRWVIQNHLVSYAYSIKLWDILQNKSSGSQSHKFVSFAPNYLKVPDTNQMRGLRRGNLFDLLEAKNEAKTISKLFNGKLFINENATRDNFLQSTTAYNFHHLAMHSVLENDYSKSSLVFTENQKVFFDELYQLNFPSKMVVLSACNTGVGAQESGEGVMSLSRALTYAGVKSSVYSLWQVPDKETSEIMVAFYENLKKGQSKDEALAKSKRQFIAKNPMKNHPFYWAGFVVNGDVQLISQSSSLWLYFGIATLVLLAIVVFRKRLFQFRK